MLPETIHRLSAVELAERATARKLRGVFDVTNDDYHGGPGISSTQVKLLLESPAAFTLRSLVEPTPAMEFGTALHAAILEPELFAETYVEEPAFDKRTKDGKAGWEAFQAQLGGRKILSSKDWDTINAMAASIGRSKVWESIRRGRREVAAYAARGVDGQHVLLKAKADLIFDDVIYDVKTTSDASPRAFARAIGDFGYHISAAYYMDVFADAVGVIPSAFVWIAVEKTVPFAVRYYTASPATLEQGRFEYERALQTYAECVKTDNWPAFPDEYESIELPAYMMKR